MDIWEEMYLKAKDEYHPEKVSPYWWGDKRYNK